MGIIQPMAEFPSETTKARWTNKFKVLKEKEKLSNQNSIFRKIYYSKIKAKQRHFQTKEI